MMKHLVRSIAFGSALAVSGCVSLLPETAPAKPRYHISAIDSVDMNGGAVAWSLSIEEPRATRVYDTVKLAVSAAPGKIEYFAKAEWADRAPRLFQTAVIQSFEDSERILGVGDRSAMPVGDFVLQMDIRKIELNVRNSGKTADVSVYARLGDGRGKVYAAKLINASQPAGGDSADDVVAAFDASFDRVIAEIVNWTFDQGQAAVIAGS